MGIVRTHITRLALPVGACTVPTGLFAPRQGAFIQHSVISEDVWPKLLARHSAVGHTFDTARELWAGLAHFAHDPRHRLRRHANCPRESAWRLVRPVEVGG